MNHQYLKKPKLYISYCHDDRNGIPAFGWWTYNHEEVAVARTKLKTCSNADKAFSQPKPVTTSSAMWSKPPPSTASICRAHAMTERISQTILCLALLLAADRASTQENVCDGTARAIDISNIDALDTEVFFFRRAARQQGNARGIPCSGLSVPGTEGRRCSRCARVWDRHPFEPGPVHGIRRRQRGSSGVSTPPVLATKSQLAGRPTGAQLAGRPFQRRHAESGRGTS